MIYYGILQLGTAIINIKSRKKTLVFKWRDDVEFQSPVHGLKLYVDAAIFLTVFYKTFDK